MFRIFTGLRFAAATAVLLVAGFPPTRSFAQSVETEMYFDGISLNVTSGTSLHGMEDPLFDCAPPWFYPWVECYVTTLMAARVDTELWSPTDLVREETVYGAIFATDEYSYYPDEPGWWLAVGDHYLEAVVELMLCNVLDMECECPYGCNGTPVDLYAGQTTASVYLFPFSFEPPFLCDAGEVTDFVVFTMTDWDPLPYERGGRIVCVSGIAQIVELEDSFAQVFPGNYTPTNDPCTLELSGVDAIGGFHSHPLFTTVSQMEAGVGCGRDPGPYTNDERNMKNIENYSFQGGDFNWPIQTGSPFYLLVPNTSEIKMLNTAGQTSSVWSE